MENSIDTEPNGGTKETVTKDGIGTSNEQVKPEDCLPKQTTPPPEGPQLSSQQNPTTEPAAAQHANVDQNPVQNVSPKKGRRVSFPLDEHVVSGYMDAPNPWNDGEF